MNGCNPTPDKFDISGARPRRLDPHLERALTLALARRSLPCTFASSLTLVCTFPCLSFCLSLSLSLVFSSVNMPLPPTSFLLHVNPRSSGLSFLPVLLDFRSVSWFTIAPKWKRKREREEGRSRRRSIEREGTVCAGQSLLPSLSHVANRRTKARGLAFLLPAESAVRSVFG